MPREELEMSRLNENQNNYFVVTTDNFMQYDDEVKDYLEAA